MANTEDTIKFNKLKKAEEKHLGRVLTKNELNAIEDKVISDIFSSVPIPEIEESDEEIQALKE